MVDMMDMVNMMEGSSENKQKINVGIGTRTIMMITTLIMITKIIWSLPSYFLMFIQNLFVLGIFSFFFLWTFLIHVRLSSSSFDFLAFCSPYFESSDAVWLAGWAITGPFSFSSPIIRTNQNLSDKSHLRLFIWTIIIHVCCLYWHLSGISMLLLFHHIIWWMFEVAAKEQVRGIKGMLLKFAQIWEILSGGEWQRNPPRGRMRNIRFERIGWDKSWNKSSHFFCHDDGDFGKILW